MPTDKILAALKDMSNAEYFAMQASHFNERFPEEVARDAFNHLTEIIRATLPDTVDAEEDLLSVAEFVEKTGDPPPMIADGILSANSLLIISARPKQGKTFFALQIAEDIARGRPLLGRYDVPKAGPVVYFAMEGSKQQWKSRIVQRGMDAGNPPVYIYTGRRDFTTPDGIEWMIKKVAPVNPTVIIIDTARQALNMEAWNDADKVNARIRPLVDAVQQRGPLTLPDGCCVILIHHNNKNALAEGGDKMSGSNALQSNADGYIIIDHKKRIGNGNMQAKAECEGRTDMPAEFMWEMDTETLQIKVLDDDETTAAQSAQRLAALERHFPSVTHAISQFEGGATLADICTKSGINRGIIHKVITAMIEKLMVVVAGTRPSKRGAPATLYINNISPYMEKQLNQEGETDPETRPDVAAFFDGTAESTKTDDEESEDTPEWT